MTKLEEIAAAMCAQCAAEFGGPVKLEDSHAREAWISSALAAVRAMREPSIDMMDNMNDVIIDDPEYGPFNPSMHDCGEIWKAGIDSILADTGESK